MKRNKQEKLSIIMRIGALIVAVIMILGIILDSIM